MSDLQLTTLRLLGTGVVYAAAAVVITRRLGLGWRAALVAIAAVFWGLGTLAVWLTSPAAAAWAMKEPVIGDFATRSAIVNTLFSLFPLGWLLAGYALGATRWAAATYVLAGYALVLASAARSSGFIWVDGAVLWGVLPIWPAHVLIWSDIFLHSKGALLFVQAR